MKRILILGILALTAILGASCTTDSVAPTEQSRTPEFARIETSPSAAAQGLAPGAKVKEVPILPTEVTKLIGAEGGVITLGRYVLAIPAGALEKPVDITVRSLEQDGAVGCELLPHGLLFRTSAQLKMDLSGTNMAHQLNTTIYWWDAENGAWVDTNGFFTGFTQSVTTALPHFSTYYAGRAGW
jgi:hypothetical protein